MNEADIKTLEDIFSHHPEDKNELIAILQEAQEKFGYLPQPVMEKVANHLHLPTSNVYGVATFYALFKLVPSGKNTIRVCRGTACHVRGGARILRDVENRLGVKAGETTLEELLRVVSPQ